ncbi:MAG TPA: hypothetical protein VLH15_10720 [Dehalococcoidales bacterium]|nr:hypothetical protein [Dehalococcoidales bacterium]
MNYIIHFQSRNNSRPVNPQLVKEYFQEQAGYTVNNFQSLYSNEDSGVFFTFEYGGRMSGGNTPGQNILPVFFNINYGKPHVFVLEAEPHLAEFIRHFDLQVSDLSMRGSNYMDYNELDFYHGWNAGNEAYYREMLRSNNPKKLFTLPLREMKNIWRWNFHVGELQSEIGQQVFIPRVKFIEYRDVFSPAVIWTDGLPVALPRVERVILYRRELTSGLRFGKKEDICVVNLSDIEPLLKDYPKSTENLEYYTIIHTEPPKEIKRFFQTQKAVKSDDIQFINLGDVHDLELIEKIKSSNT